MTAPFVHVCVDFSCQHEFSLSFWSLKRSRDSMKFADDVFVFYRLN